MSRRPANRQSGQGWPAQSRPGFPFQELLAGLPCVLLALAMVGAPVVASYKSTTWDRYSWAMLNHLKQQEMPGALVCLKRLLSLDPGRPELIFMMAQVYDRQGKTDWAEALALSLAPANRQGYPPARKWLAQRAYRTSPVAVAATPARPGGDVAKPKPKAEVATAGSAGVLEKPGAVAERRRLAGATETQLKEWLSEEPNSTEAKTMLGLLYAEKGRFAEARDTLEPVAAGRPVLLLALAKCSAALGDKEAMRRYATETREVAREIVTAHPDEPAPRSIWSLACTMLEDYQGALDALGSSKASPATAARKAEMATVCASWAHWLDHSRSAKEKGRGDQILAVVQLGLGYDETNEALLTDLAGLVTNGEKASRSAAAAALRLMIRERRTPAAAWYALGMEAWVNERPAEARRSWEQAYASNPRILLLANNLAWNLASTPPADLPRALTLIDRALAESQGDRRLRVIRGEILGKLGRWDDAAAELERALAQGEAAEKIRPALANAYKHLGRTGTGAGAAR